LTAARGCSKAVNQIAVRLLPVVEQGPAVGAERFQVAALALGVERVEGQGALTRTAGPGQHGQPVAGKVHVDILQIMLTRAPDADPIGAAGRRAVLTRPRTRGRVRWRHGRPARSNLAARGRGTP